MALALVALRIGERTPAALDAPEASMPTVIAAVGFSALVVGLELGPWLIAIGAGVLAIGLGGLARERRTEPRGRP
jgi:hypothetical protein